MRLFGAALVIHGGVGVALLTLVSLSVAPTLAGMDALMRSSAQVEVTLATTRDAFDGFAISLAEGKISAEHAAASARSSAGAARGLADGMSVSIFGVQPLLSLAIGFRQQSMDLEALAVELDILARSLGSNERDVRALREDVAALHDLAAELGAAPDARAGLLGPALYLLIAWLMIEALAVAWLGIQLTRGRLAATR